MEAILLANQASVVGNNSTARKLGGFAAWIVTNVSRGASAVAGGYNTGTGLVAAYTPGTGRAFTETILKTVQQAVFTSGGNPKIIMMAVGQKPVFSSFTGLAQTRLMPTGGGASQATIIGAADTYVGDFGTLTTVVNRVQQAGTAFLIDTSMVSLTTLRPIKADNPANTGDEPYGRIQRRPDRT
jgi:hypothetical protein